MRIIPPVQTALWLAAQQLAARLGPGSDRRRVTAGTAAAGGLLISIAGAAGLDALCRFLTRGTTWHPHRPQAATVLVTDGPNAITRNPMYLAMVLGLVGTGLLSGRPWTAVAAVGLAATLTPQIEREEAALAELFGDEWRTYSARVPRWLGSC